MSSTRFDLEFAGELTPGTKPGQARAKIKDLFKLSDEAVAQLFSGTPVTVKRGVDSALASRLHAAFAQAGALVRIIPAGGGTSVGSGADAERSSGEQGSSRPAAELPPLDLFGAAKPKPKHPILHAAFHYFERSLAFVLLILIAGVSVLALIELCVILYKDVMIVKNDGFLLGLDELFEVFGMFLIVLIAVELMASIYMYMVDKSVHVEMMLLIAITALARKVVVLDLEGKGDPAMYMIGMAALLATLLGGYYLMKRLDKSVYRRKSN
ncbi:phosphate-starvation-inducible PsiE family protein [Lamprobacter modestohalophilus]|uniref:phosphate-starvation-inducible PsiE family protein n=1 Tax=Lamprobacter modestohalophilus TaxID=1064514 RepID=UPI002ADEC478|nr:phosphate-starvation-inducible PsiE family protein [Lamprobacter modestohalophilus]MEA1051774.1 phosphate-starvation-inducible PsiE family protein [Lamprobacter modestohalophilus]